MDKNLWLYIGAGALAIFFGPLYMPLYFMLIIRFAFTIYIMLINGFVLLAISGILHKKNKYRVLKVIIGFLGFSWVILFLYIGFPILSIALF